MWEYEHTVETVASPDAVWGLRSNILSWPRWNAGIVTVTA
jgi:hypothetical protein